jgi:signal transduction histidine kinase
MKIFENKHINLFQILINNNLFLSFILITVIAQLLVNQAKNLNNKSKDLFKLNKQLVQSNESLKESMGQIMSLYQTVHSFINLSSKDKLIDSILCYTQEITGSSLIFLTFPSSEETWNIKTSKEFSREIKNIIIERIANEWNNIKNIDSPIELSLQDDNFMIIPLNSTTKSYGVLGIELINDRASINVNQIMDQLKFIASLSSMALERLDFEEVKQQILINQEQNRIANEIHDDVSQRLFALSCGIFSIIKENEGDITEEIKGELSNINDLLNTTIKQLRKIIYDMSWKKSGASALQMNIKKFISDMSKLYNINIVLHIEGDEELINSTIKNCIYRIICESTGNAARHSECDNIVVSLSIQQNCTRLNIYDNGYGFDLKNTITSKEAGMGIKNIYNLVYSLNGQIDINSVRGKGTSINIILPNNMVNKEQGAVI